MAIPSIYLNLEDDVAAIVARLKRQTTASQIVLVCPKRCFLFKDPGNLFQLKAQADLLGKELFVLTMDERGQQYAKEAGLGLKYLPKTGPSRGISDISSKPVEPQLGSLQPSENKIMSTVKGLGEMAKKFVPAAIFSVEHKSETESPAQQIKQTQLSEPSEIKATEVVYPAMAEQRQAADVKPSKNHTQKVVTAVVAASLALLLLLIFVILPQAKVVVYPKTEPLTRDMEISLSGNVGAVDLDKLVLPANKISETVNVSNKFQSQGQKQVGNRSTGTVVIYNFTKLPLNLKASTTILSVAGKNYFLVNNITGLRPTTYKNARTKEVDPASLADPVEIIAEQGGENYDLPAGTRLEITNQVLGSKPQLLYAKTNSEISGGTTRFLSIISADDYNNAKTQLENQILQTERDKLKRTGLVLGDGAFILDSPQFTTDNPVGTQTPNFQASLQVKISGLVFRQSDLNDLVLQRIKQTLSQDKNLQPSGPDQDSYKISNLDLNNLLAVMNLHFEGQAVFNVNLQNISPELVGKTLNQVNEILRSKAEIDKVEITLAPAWQKSFPFFASKIKVSLGTTN